jgi:hypothetical protein
LFFTHMMKSATNTPPQNKACLLAEQPEHVRLRHTDLVRHLLHGR